MHLPKTSRARPDSGWSWVVAVSCCFIYFVMYGMTRLSGVFLVAIRNEFPVSRETAALPFTITGTIKHLCSPIVGVLGKRFGVRIVAGAGSFLSFCGIVMCSLATDVFLINIGYGIIFGIGFSMACYLLPVSINQYFTSHRATALGIAFSGGCFGSFFLPPLIDLLLREFALNGTFLLVSTLLLHCVPLAMLLRKPPYDIEDFSKYRNHESETISLNSDVDTKVISESAKRDSKCNFKVISEDTKSFNALNENIGDQPNIEICKSRSIGEEMDNMTSEQIVIKPIYNSDNITVSHSETTNRHISNETGTLRQFLRLCTHPVYIFICISKGLFSYALTITLTCVIDFAKDIGTDEEMLKYVLMSFSIGDLIGRLSLGSITDRGYMTKAGFTSSCFFFQGITFVSFALAKTFWTLSVALFFYGIFQAGLMIMSSLLVAHYVESDLQMLAMPCSYVLCAPFSAVVSVVIGYFRERQGSYVGLFYKVAVLSFITFIGWFLLPILQKRCKKQTSSF